MIGPLASIPFDLPLLAIQWLFADLDVRVIFFVIAVVIAIITSISQYLTKQKEEEARQRRLEAQAKREAARRKQLEQEGGASTRTGQSTLARTPGQPQGPATPVDENVAAEIRDFLERASTGRPAGQGPRQKAPVSTHNAAREETHHPLADRPARHSSIEERPIPTSHSNAQRSTEAKIVLAEEYQPEQDRRQSDILRTQEQAEARKRQVAAARSKSDASGKSSKFDRKLGSLKQAAGQKTADLPETMATDIAAMFTDTHNIRQAIIISEILNRPVHRWK